MKTMSSMDHASRAEHADTEMCCGRHTIGYQVPVNYGHLNAHFLNKLA